MYSVMGIVSINKYYQSFIFVKLVFHFFALTTYNEKSKLSKNVLFKKKAQL